MSFNVSDSPQLGVIEVNKCDILYLLLNDVKQETVDMKIENIKNFLFEKINDEFSERSGFTLESRLIDVMSYFIPIKTITSMSVGFVARVQVYNEVRKKGPSDLVPYLTRPEISDWVISSVTALNAGDRDGRPCLNIQNPYFVATKNKPNVNGRKVLSANNIFKENIDFCCYKWRNIFPDNDLKGIFGGQEDGMCSGECAYFAYLYLKTKDHPECQANPYHHMLALAVKFQQGADIESVFLQITGQQTGECVKLKYNLDDPMKTFFDYKADKADKKPLDLPVGVYFVVISCLKARGSQGSHQMVYIKTDQNAFFFDPNKGIAAINQSFPLQRAICSSGKFIFSKLEKIDIGFFPVESDNA